MGTSASIRHCQNPVSEKGLKQHTRVQKTRNLDTPALFGVSLQRLREKGRLQNGVPLVLKRMVEFLEKYGLQQSGVFRVCGSAKCCKTLRECLDRGKIVDLEGVDVPTVATLLKLYLRELPDGLIPHTHSMCMQQALKDSKDGSEFVESLKEILQHLPDDNYNLLSYLLHFLSRVTAHSQWNQMTSENLATVFGPCIFHIPEGLRMLEEQTMCNTLTLHLLEKHTQLIPNTPDSYTRCTQSCNNSHTHSTHSTESRVSSPPLQQEQSYNSETEYDDSVGGAKETSVCRPSLIDSLTLFRRFSNIDLTDETGGNMQRETEAEKNEEAGLTESDPIHKSSQRTMDHSSLTCSDTEFSTPHSSHTDIDTHSNTTGETHCKLQTHEFPDTHSQEATQSNTSHTHSLSCETQTETRSSHLEPGSAHTYSSNAQNEARHESSDYGCTHNQSPDTPTTRLEKDEDANSTMSLCITAPPTFSVQIPVTDQAETLNNKQDSASCAVTHECCVIEDDADCSNEISTSRLRQHNALITHPEIMKLRTELSESLKQPKELRSRVCPHTPTAEDTANMLTQRLKEKRLELNLPQRIQDMCHAQLALEKLTLQKCLLHYERLHGRPRSKEERIVMKELYSRYRLVKQAFNNSADAQTRTTGVAEMNMDMRRKNMSRISPKEWQKYTEREPPRHGGGTRPLQISEGQTKTVERGAGEQTHPPNRDTIAI